MAWVTLGWQGVNRHTGGLEKLANTARKTALVNRHTGGLETVRLPSDGRVPS